MLKMHLRLTYIYTVISSILVFGVSCKKFLKVDDSAALVPKQVIFENDVTANAAVTGIYVTMYQAGFANGDYMSITGLAPLSADEMVTYQQNDLQAFQFEDNDLLADNAYLLGLWSSMYKTIYQANSVLEGLQESTTVTNITKSKLKGESLFIRAFCNFYLVNFFGRIPLNTTTDYKINAVAKRAEIDDIYNAIKSDLLEAITLLSDEYPAEGHVRPNKYAAKALLARVYLYLRDYQNADKEATDVIDSQLYFLTDNLNDAFLSSSTEAIWQIPPVIPDYIVTQEGFYFISDNIFGGPFNNVLREDFVNGFEADDERKEKWIGSFDTGSEIIRFPYKYKLRYSDGTGFPEYSMVLRYAEQYLIRSEARANLNLLAEAIKDVDKIRNRAGLSLIGDTNPGVSQEDLIAAIIRERRSELFTEWGHRWLDLKRLQKSTTVLQAIKPNWDASDTLYLIPQSELNKNPSLKD